MTMKVTFQLSDHDLDYFRKEISDAGARYNGDNGAQIIEAAEQALSSMSDTAPEFVIERASKLDRMIEMLKDTEWCLEGDDRDNVLRLLAYFAEPHDLIHDAIPGIGFLDDAIMVELVVRELRHELEAYQDFCRFRAEKPKLLNKESEAPTSREEWLGARRAQLQNRMRRRYRRQGRF
jgi:uncharacterized membrane protein YkvA (DUF1232 family)